MLKSVEIYKKKNIHSQVLPSILGLEVLRGDRLEDLISIQPCSNDFKCEIPIEFCHSTLVPLWFRFHIGFGSHPNDSSSPVTFSFNANFTHDLQLEFSKNLNKFR